MSVRLPNPGIIPPAAVLDRGACRTTPTFIFYSDSPACIAAALATCARCHVTDTCLQHALVHEPYGTWGGKTEAERDRMLRGRWSHGLCGTEAGWHRHNRRHEGPCDPCRQAKNAANRERVRARKETAA